MVTVGIAALVRKLRGRREDEGAPVAPSADDDPADELRRKLAETREDEMPASGMPPTAEPGVEERRAAVHDEGRAAIDEMQQSAED